jgi:hypothetical protein
VQKPLAVALFFQGASRYNAWLVPLICAAVWSPINWFEWTTLQKAAVR